MFPPGLATRTLTFGRYTSALGTSRGGKVMVGFEKSMLHIPSGEVVTSGMESVAIDPDTGIGTIDVPITITDDLLADWRTEAPFVNQRLKVEIDVPGYREESIYLDLSASDPMVLDFDQLDRYASVGGLPISRAAVESIAGLVGVVSAQVLAMQLQPFIATGTLTPEQIEDIEDSVVERLEPPINLVLIFENALA